MPGPKQKPERAPEREREDDREPQNAPTDIERDAPAQPEPDVERGRDMVERRPHRDEP